MNSKVSLINQALNAAESSVKLAKQLLEDLETGGDKQSFKNTRTSGNNLGPNPENKLKEKPGAIGIFDGENMVTETGEKYPVPEAYASKSMLVCGDTLKMIDDGEGKRFKQIEHVKRYRTTGILTKKEGKFRLVTPEGSYKILPSTIEHYKGEVGDEVVAYLPAGNLTTTHAAMESINKKTPGDKSAEKESQVKEQDKELVVSEVKAKKKEEASEPAPQEKVKKPNKEETKEIPENQPVAEIKVPELAEDELR